MPEPAKGDEQRQRLAEIASVVFGAYPARRKTEGELADYAIHLTGVAVEDLGRAAMRVTEHHPLWPPTAGELKQLAVKLAKEARKRPEPRPRPEPPPAIKLPDDNPFAQLAKKFQEENVKAPMEGFPDDVHVRRARQVMGLLDKVDAPMSYRIPKPSPLEIEFERDKF